MMKDDGGLIVAFIVGLVFATVFWTVFEMIAPYLFAVGAGNG